MNDLQRNLTGRFCIDLQIRLWQVLAGVWLSFNEQPSQEKRISTPEFTAMIFNISL